MKRLYEVNATYYVMADSAVQAEAFWPRAADTVTVIACPATKCDSDWFNALPFNADRDDERTCGQILQEMKA